MIDDSKLEKTLDWLRENASKAAKARANRVYLEEWIPALRATMAARFMEEGDSASAADIKAKGSEEYETALKGLRAAIEEDEVMRWHKSRADAVVSAWQTMSANQRAQSKIG